MSSPRRVLAAVLLIAGSGLGATSMSLRNQTTVTVAMPAQAAIPVQFTDGADNGEIGFHTNKTGFWGNATSPGILGTATVKPIKIDRTTTTGCEIRLLRTSVSGSTNWDNVSIGIYHPSGIVWQFGYVGGTAQDWPGWVAFSGGQDGDIAIFIDEANNLGDDDVTLGYRMEIRPAGLSSPLIQYRGLNSTIHDTV
ncbi:MAG: hypothetical protein ACT4PT_04555 [Methanobacteriota archaeon]